MESIYKKFIEELVEAEKDWQSADNLVYVTYPVVKDIQLILKAFENLHKGLISNISNILKLEYFCKRIILSKNKDKNLEIFFKKCAKNYDINDEDCKILNEILYIGKKHKESSVEFSKNEKIIILDDILGNVVLTNDKMKNFVKVSRKLLENTNRKIRKFI